LIERDDDPRLEPYRHVGDPRWLEARGLFVAEGRLVLQRLIEANRYAIDSILVTPAALRAIEPFVTPAHTVHVAAQSIVNGVTGFNFHRGCLALAHRPPAPAPLAAFSTARRLVVLEGVGNPDNIGGIFRTAAALQADGIALDPTSGDPWYRKALRTSMGAVLHLPFTRAESWPGALDGLRHMGMRVVALSPAGSLTLDEFAGNLGEHDRLAILAGAEGGGLTPDAIAHADTTVRIPIDPHSDSLNVVVAVSVALYRLRAWSTSS
jgi:tRNA G18 (ribose-2'-O)-methylase SpoU